MDEPSTPTRNALPRWLPVLILVLFGLAVRAVVVARSEASARDSFGFIRYALRLEREPWPAVIRTSDHPPGYPLALMVVSWPVRAAMGGVDCDSMVLSAQLTSVLFGVLLVLPMVKLGEELYDRRAGYLAAGLFQCLPVWTRFTSDGLTEAAFLFWLTVAIWLGVSSLRRPSAARLFRCGLAAGCAFLTRPEGGEVVLAIGAVLIGMQLTSQFVQPWRSVTVQLGALAVGLLVLLGPYVGTTGRLTNKNTPLQLLGDPSVDKTYFGPSTAAAPAAPRLLIAGWWEYVDDKSRSRVGWALEELSYETVKTFHYIGVTLTCIGLVVGRRLIRNGPGLCALGLLTVGHAALLVKMTATIGYLSERHTLILVLCGCFPAAVGVIFVSRYCLLPSYRNLSWSLAAVPWLFLLGMFLSGLPTLLKPMHANRAGHRAAGEWLAKHAPPTAGILDPFCWARYYAGREFRDDSSKDPAEEFVIVEATDNPHSRLPQIPEAKAKAAMGRLVYHWPENKPADKATVHIYQYVPARDQPAAAK